MKYEYVLKLTGKASIPEALEIGHNYTVSIGGSVTSKTEVDSQGEEHILYYKFEPVAVEILTQTGQTIKAKDTRSRSTQMRSLLFKRWREQNIAEEFDEWYDKRMVELMANL